MTLVQHSEIKSVLNTDGFDRRVFKELYNQSEKLRFIVANSVTKLPTYLHLVADIWAALYKNQPRLRPKNEIDYEVLPHRELLDKVLSSTEFVSLREYTRLDEVISAMGTALLAEVFNELIQENQTREANHLREQQMLPQKARKAPTAGTAREEEYNHLQDRQGKQQTKEENPPRDLKSEQQREHARAVAEATANSLKKILQTKQDIQNLEGRLQKVREDLATDHRMISSMLGGLRYGKNAGQQAYISPAAAIRLSEQIKTTPKLRRIAQLAGRLKKVALRKQKLKTNDNVERTSVSIGNELSLLLPQEMILLSEKHKLGFLKKYAEGKLLQYSPKSKDFMGRGPVIVCLDTSGSMLDNEEKGIYKESEAKAVMLALLAIAEQQKRPFAVVNFSSHAEVKSWEFSDSGRIGPETIVEMAEFSWGGGTNFTAPLEAALEILNKNKYKKADIIFISDGCCMLNKSWLEKFNNIKQKKKFHIIGVQLGNKDGGFNNFADELINTDSLLDKQVKNIVLSI